MEDEKRKCGKERNTPLSVVPKISLWALGSHQKEDEEGRKSKPEDAGSGD